MSGKNLKKVWVACAIVCSIIGFFYVTIHIACKLIEESMKFLDNSDVEPFLDEEEPVEPIIVSADESDDDEPFSI